MLNVPEVRARFVIKNTDPELLAELERSLEQQKDTKSSISEPDMNERKWFCELLEKSAMGRGCVRRGCVQRFLLSLGISFSCTVILSNGGEDMVKENTVNVSIHTMPLTLETIAVIDHCNSRSSTLGAKVNCIPHSSVMTWEQTRRMHRRLPWKGPNVKNDGHVEQEWLAKWRW